MSLKLKVIALPVIMVILAISLMIWAAYNIMQKSLNDEIHQSLLSAQLTIADRIDGIKQRLNCASPIARLPKLISGVKDREYNTVKEFAKKELKDIGVDFVTITDANGIVLARGHSDKYNDDLHERPSFKTARSGKKFSDILSSKSAVVKLSLRQSYPIYDGKDIVGTIEYGVNLASRNLIEELKHILQMDITVFQNEQPLISTIGKERATILDSTVKNQELFNTVLQDQKTYYTTAKTADATCSEVFWPIHNSQGVIGMFFIAKSNESIDIALQNMVTTLGIYGIAAIIILFLISYLLGAAIDRQVAEQNYWYDQILNKINSPISVVNMKMEMIFMNTRALKVSQQRKSNAGSSTLTLKDCAQSWQTDICSQENNPLHLLQKDGTTMSSQKINGIDYEIEANYLENLKGNKVGMFLVLNDVSEKCQLKRVATEVTGVSTQLSKSCTEVNSASQSLSRGASEQAAVLEEVTSTMTEIEGQITANADNAVKASELTTKATHLASDGQQQMSNMVEAMEQINENSKLNQNLINTIDDIAFQTNLLALNAAVEAARAGHHGKGFAVVAEEVRNLASRSAKATAESSTLVEKSNNQIHEGMDITRKTAESLLEITEVINNINELTGNIAVASNEQAQGISQVNIGLNQVESVMQQNALNAQETADSAVRLSQQENSLNKLIQQF